MPSIIRAGQLGGDDAEPHGTPPYMPLGRIGVGSDDVFTNNQATARMEHIYIPNTHSSGGNTHIIGVALTGSLDVLVNGFGIHRTGDQIGPETSPDDCPTVAGAGSDNVFANGE